MHTEQQKKKWTGLWKLVLGLCLGSSSSSTSWAIISTVKMHLQPEGKWALWVTVTKFANRCLALKLQEQIPLFRGLLESFVFPLPQPPIMVCVINKYAHIVEVLLQNFQAFGHAFHHVIHPEVQELIEYNRLQAFHLSRCGVNCGAQTAPCFQNDIKTVPHPAQKMEILMHLFGARTSLFPASSSH